MANQYAAGDVVDFREGTFLAIGQVQDLRLSARHRHEALDPDYKPNVRIYLTVGTQTIQATLDGHTAQRIADAIIKSIQDAQTLAATANGDSESVALIIG